MAKTVYFTATSIDGFIADENNSLEWLFPADSGAQEADSGAQNVDRFGDFLAGVGAMAMGATTYAWVLDHERLLARSSWGSRRSCSVREHRCCRGDSPAMT